MSSGMQTDRDWAEGLSIRWTLPKTQDSAHG